MYVHRAGVYVYGAWCLSRGLRDRQALTLTSRVAWTLDFGTVQWDSCAELKYFLWLLSLYFFRAIH